MRRTIVTGLLLALATPAAASAMAPEPRYQDYVAGRLALSERDLGIASDRYSAALAADPDSPALLRRAFEVALAAGDYERARSLAKALEADQGDGGLVALLAVSDAVIKKRWDKADAAIGRIGDGGFSALIGPITRAWVDFGRGDRNGAIDGLALPQRSDVVLRSYVAEHRARMLESLGGDRAGLEAWQAFVVGAGTGAASSGLRVRGAAAAVRQGDKAAALTMLAPAEGSLADSARARIESGKSLGIPADGPREGLAALYARLGADLAQARNTSAAIQLARLSALLAPKSDSNRMLLAELLGVDRQPEAGLEVIRPIKSGSVYADDALGLRARLLNDAGKEDEALAMLKSGAARRGATAGDWTRLGEFHRSKERNLEAVAAYTQAIALTAPDAPSRWTLYFLRGGAHEQAGDWAKAEPDLREAYRLAPEQAIVLNYLGYGLLDRGEKLDEAEVLIRKASDKAPNNAAITDSLGWAYFRTGRFQKAVEALERAVAGAPGDPTINEHLGDAYWAVGRKLEARFRWRAANEGEPDDTQKARLAAKLEWGMDRASLAGTVPPPKAP